MTTRRHSKVFQQLRQAVLAHDGAGLTDADLMSRFVAQRDGAALEALIRRHGSMVWSVCRRVLSNEQDAEDAFQASFLVFVRKAASIRGRAQVGNWLYGVAYRTALKARTTDARRRTKERQAAEMAPIQTDADAGWSDLLPVLDQELNRLPDKYRTAIVLCELECRPRKEAARQLGVPEGTLSSRLATGRRMLAKRLGRPGLALSAAAVAASAIVPAPLLASTVKAVSLVAAGQATVAGVVTVRVASLTEGVIKAMLVTKLSTGAALLAVVAVLAAGAGTAAYCAPAGRADPKPPTPPVAAVPHPENKKDKDEVKREETEWGEAVDGVQARIRPAAVEWELNAGPHFALDLRNHGKESHKAYRDSQHCEIELDGKWYLSGEPEALQKKVSTSLEPGKQEDNWVIVSLTDGTPWGLKALGRKASDPAGEKDELLQVTAGKHTLRVAFVFEDGIRPISQPVEIEVGKESAWGEAVDGVQARIRTSKVVWKAGEAPAFILDLRNHGQKTPDQRRVPYDCQIEVDKVWYSYDEPSGPYVSLGQQLKPGEQVNDWTTVSPDKDWGSFPGKAKHFPLSPGKHTVRIAYRLQGTTPAIRPISGPIEIEVAAKPPADDAETGGNPPRTLPPAKPTNEIPVRRAVEGTPAMRAVEIQKKLSETIDYELAVDTTLDKALNELLTQHGIPWTVNDAAFGANIGNSKDIAQKTEVEKVELVEGVTRATVLKRLLAHLPVGVVGDDDPVYLIRPDRVEITTWKACQLELFPGRDFASPRPAGSIRLAYGSFDKVPLSEALAELRRTTGANVIVAGCVGKEGETKVTADFIGVPLETAVRLLADMADLRMVRLANVYYVTTPDRARGLEAEEEKRRKEEVMGDSLGGIAPPAPADTAAPKK